MKENVDKGGKAWAEVRALNLSAQLHSHLKEMCQTDEKVKAI